MDKVNTMKQLLILTLLLCLIPFASAGEILKGEGTVNIYGCIEDKVWMTPHTDHNYNKTLCHNATVIEGTINIEGTNDYELDYIFTADFNDTLFVTRILTVKQVKTAGGLLEGDVCLRTLSLDGIEIGQYEATAPWWGNVKRNTIHYNVIDEEIRFGDDIIKGSPLAFTQFNYQDQQDYLYTQSSSFSTKYISHTYISRGDEHQGSGVLELGGLTGIFYNVFGDSALTRLPIIGNAVASFGEAMQALLFLPLSIVQFSFNFIFSILTMIANDWWYAVMLMELFCIFPALKYSSYSKIVDVYITKHIVIFTFLWQVIVLNLIRLIVRFAEVIRNMFRI